MAKPVLLVMSPSDNPYLPMLNGASDRFHLKTGVTADELADQEAEALFAWVPNRTEIGKLLTRTPRLRWIHSRWAGLDSLLTPALVDHPLVITNARGVYSQSLGEFVIFGALYFAKDTPRLLAAQAQHKWEPFTMLEIRGATMGISGYGDIGRACASRAHSLGMRVLATRRRPELSGSDPYVDRVFPREGLLEMIAECDYVVSAAPLTPETHKMFGEREFKAMKSSAVFMNVGRGPVVDEAALARALESKRIRGAALDVFETEPLSPESPLWSQPNVLISPHCADNTPTWHEESMQFFLRNLDHFAKGEPLENVVDKTAGY